MNREHIDLGQFFKDCELKVFQCWDKMWSAHLSLPVWATPLLDEISQEMGDTGRRLGNVWMRQPRDGVYWNSRDGKTPGEAIAGVWVDSMNSLAPYFARRAKQPVSNTDLMKLKKQDLVNEVLKLREKLDMVVHTIENFNEL